MKRAYGFTIVELLIVIVVIAILAAISVATYSGISARAENNKSIVAMEGYLKAIDMYKVDHGDIPRLGDGLCLGQDYPWEYEGAASGNNQCRYSTVGYYRESKAAALNTALSDYTSTLPQPSMKAIGTTTNWFRGITYYHTGAGGTYRMQMPLSGSADCPSLGGKSPIQNIITGGVLCTYVIGIHSPPT